jgi:putative acetyltransferase
MTKALKIEAASPEDFSQLALVWEASVLATHDFLHPDDFALFKSLIVAEFFPVVRLFKVQDNGAVLGFLGVSDDMIEMLFIHPNSRGSGVGKLLLRFAVDELGMRKVDVNEQNGQAVGFYQHMGFKTTGRSAFDGMGKPYPLLHLALD